MSKSALDRLDRILYILPRGAMEGGVELAELAKELEVTIRTILDDIDEVLSRAYYHPALTGSQIRPQIEGTRLRVETTGGFQRPTRLSPQEALAVALALRMRMAGEDARALESERLESLCARMEDVARTDRQGEDATPAVHLEKLDPRDQVEEVLLRGHAEGRACRIRYLSAHDTEPAERTVRPWALANGEGHWYTIAWCEAAEDVRIFRFDRTLHAELLEESFSVPEDFDGSEYVEGGQVHDGHFTEEVEVVYGAGIARWVRERWEGEEIDGGAYVVRHGVSDPRWVVRHVLQYGGDAVVRGPERYRALVREGAGEVVDHR